MTVDNWHGLYRKGWRDELIPQAFSHPAKYSFGLIEHIYQHMADEGWIEPGSVIVDPFGGIAGGAFHAMKHGCAWVGVELEARFVTLGNQNIDLWNNRYAPHFPGWGTARLIQGDSRKLLEVVSAAGGVVSSPPFEDRSPHNGGKADFINAKRLFGDYGNTEGNLGNMRGTADSLQASVSSPPYADGCAHTGGDDPKPEYVEGGEIHLPGIHGMVSSPPYAESLGDGKSGIDWSKQVDRDTEHPHGWAGENYGTTPGQLGGADDFWLAARQIVDQVYAALTPGGHAVWVVKHFVKNKQRIDFPGQWRQLCEAAGFVTVHEHRAWLVEDKGTQFTLDGNHHSRKVERKSFFRRLVENKGSPRIDWETVYCMEKRP